VLTVGATILLWAHLWEPRSLYTVKAAEAVAQKENKNLNFQLYNSQ